MRSCVPSSGGLRSEGSSSFCSLEGDPISLPHVCSDVQRDWAVIIHPDEVQYLDLTSIASPDALLSYPIFHLTAAYQNYQYRAIPPDGYCAYTVICTLYPPLSHFLPLNARVAPRALSAIRDLLPPSHIAVPTISSALHYLAGETDDSNLPTHYQNSPLWLDQLQLFETLQFLQCPSCLLSGEPSSPWLSPNYSSAFADPTLAQTGESLSSAPP